jgi:hypothetical protein
MLWTRALSQPIGRFRRLSDIRDYIRCEYPMGRPKAWDLIESLAVEAAEGGDIGDLELSLAIMVALGARPDVVRLNGA